ncbi:hypothetical protein AB8U03_16355 [Clostridium sp. Mt-5]|uniref:Transposase InsH N-terminal domain-containing protein n=1 Tax=Clostridium moutaii TaxID=3240932 RepID=A0ABV4BW65_9CLOT
MGGILLFGTAFVSASQLSRYQSLKAAVNDTKNLGNETINLQLAASYNGNNIINADSTFKLNSNDDSISSVTTVKSGNSAQMQIVILDYDSIIPEKHILKQIDSLINFDFIYDIASPFYSNTGRKSIDPVIMIKMLLIGYLFWKNWNRNFQLCLDM